MNMASPTQPIVPPQSSLTGSTINLTTGVFQPLQPRGRIAKACEKCRIRKGKVRTPCQLLLFPLPTPLSAHLQCNGEAPCERCFTHGLQCQYVSPKSRDRKKNRRTAAIPQQRSTAASPSSERTVPSSVPPPANSDSSGDASDYHRFETSPSTLSSYAVEISSSQSSPAPAHRAAPETPRPRSATFGQNPSRSSCNVLDAFPYVQAGVSRRRPLPRPIRPTEAREGLPSFLAEHVPKPEFPIRIETRSTNRTLAQSYSRLTLHNSDIAEGSSASPDRRCVLPRISGSCPL